MDFLIISAPIIVMAIITLLVVWRDPRRLRCAIALGITLQLVMAEIFAYAFKWSDYLSPQGPVIALLGLAGIGLLSVLVLAGLLIQSGVVLIRREGFGLAHSLALSLGLMILVYLALAVYSLFANQAQIATLLLLLGMPIYYLASILVSFLIYAALYGFWANRWSPPASIIVVLGAGLIADKVTPLLRARLDLGVKNYRRSVNRGTAPLLVVSGGQGANEGVAEAVAMGRYLDSVGVDRRDIVEEASSATTQENLGYTRAILGVRAEQGKWMVVTSDYHAFRAAMLLSSMKIKGNAVGAKTPRYFWASAVLREYVAILQSHWKINLLFFLGAIFPFVFMIVGILTH